VAKVKNRPLVEEACALMSDTSSFVTAQPPWNVW
jgi:hypothetical protein